MVGTVAAMQVCVALYVVGFVWSARSLLLASVLYLPALFAAMFVDGFIR